MRGIPAIISILLIFSCTKSDPLTPQPTGTMLLYVKGGNPGSESVQSEFRYDNAGNITTRISYFGEKISSQADIRYKDGKLHTVESKFDVSSSSLATHYVYGKSDFEYNAEGLVVQKNHHLKENNSSTYELRSFSVFDYNASQLPVKETRFRLDGTPYQYTNYIYDASGNIVQQEFYQLDAAGEMQLAFSTGYEHDQKKNPYLKVYHSVENIPFSINKNNIVTTTIQYTIVPQGSSTSSSTIYNAFNRQDYPLSMEENGNRFVFQYN
ncbi:MAG: hypothetical protein KIT80_02335 [Chitinophagaceae bacterium]|nr:hypothetical protein [Chitinophagaceae bacterium]MCW5925723.1 hypothetical protein [Chitinophagaceae bacterium]